MKAKLYLPLVLLLVGLVLAACGGNAAPEAAVDLTALPDTVDVATVNSIKDQPGVFLLDVREPDEYAAGHIPGITLIPMNDVPARLSEIPKDMPVIVTCRTGNRSGQVTDFLREQGFTNVHNMDGGIVAWEAAGYAVEQ